MIGALRASARYTQIICVDIVLLCAPVVCLRRGAPLLFDYARLIFFRRLRLMPMMLFFADAARQYVGRACIHGALYRSPLLSVARRDDYSLLPNLLPRCLPDYATLRRLMMPRHIQQRQAKCRMLSLLDVIYAMPPLFRHA